MKTQRTDTSEAPRQPLSDAASKSMLPFLKAFENIYVARGDVSSSRRVLGAVGESLWILEHDPSLVESMVQYGGFQTLHEHSHEAYELSALLVDSIIVRAHSSAAGSRKKRRTRQVAWIHRHHVLPSES